MTQASALELEEDLPFKRRMWRANRFGWAVFAVLLMAAGAGLFGRGPLSTTTASSGGLEVEYHRFVRVQSPSTIEITLDGGLAPEVTVSWEYLSSIELQHVTPEPREVISEGDGVRYRFAREGTQELAITFDFRIDDVGRMGGVIGAGEEEVRFTQFAYP